MENKVNNGFMSHEEEMSCLSGGKHSPLETRGESYKGAGDVTAAEQRNDRVRLILTEAAYLDIFPCQGDMYRLVMEYDDRNQPREEYLLDEKSDSYPQPVPYVWSVDGDSWCLKSGTTTLEGTKSPLTLSLKGSRGETLFEQGEVYTEIDGITLSFSSRKGEKYYGLGLRESWPHNGKELAHVIRYNHWEGKSVPFFVSTGGYGLFLNTTRWDTLFDFSSGRLHIPYGRRLDYFLFGGSPKESVSRFTMLTGRPFMPPRWSFGYWHGKYGFRTQEELEETAAKFRRKEIPLDLLFLDLHWRGAYSALEISDLEWDRDCFPEPQEMIGKINSNNIHVFGHMNTSCIVNHRDFTNPDHRAQWRKKVKKMMKSGFEGCMVDAGEGKGLDGNHNFMNWHVPGGRFNNGMTPEQMANIWGKLYNKTAITAMRESRPEKRIFGLTRAATAGSQKYGLIWSGDHNSTWEEFRRELSSGLNMSLSGLPFWTYDIGGIAGMPTKELYCRWFMAACFTPVVRAHGRFSREPWLYGAFFEKLARKYLSLRMKLIPYLYSAAREMVANGTPIVRPMIYTFPGDFRCETLWDQWMLGDSLLVAPVIREGEIERELYLPEGFWYDFYSGEMIEGGQTISVEAPLDHIPVFVRAGTVLPMGGDRLYSGDDDSGEMEMRVYPVPAGQKGVEAPCCRLYEDDGDSHRHEEGIYSLLEFNMEEGDSLSLTITVHKREYGDASHTLIFRPVNGGKENRLNPDGISGVARLIWE